MYESETDPADAITVADIIAHDEEYSLHVSGLKDAIYNAFSVCHDYLQSFEPFKEMVLENQQLDAQELWDGATNGELLLDDFRMKLEMYGGQAANITRLDDIKECGIIQVRARTFKEMIAPSPAKCLDKLEELLPQLAIVKLKSLLDVVTEANLKLNHPPTNVAEFVYLLDFIDLCNERKDDLEDEYLEVVKHYALMNSHHVKVNEMDRAAYQMLVPEYAQMKNMLDLLDSTQDQDKTKWSQMLEEDIKLFRAEIVLLKNAALDERLVEDVESLEPILAVVNGLSEQTTRMQETARSNQKFQALFGQQLERYPELDEVTVDINLKKDMWDTRTEIFMKTEGWKECLVMEMPVKEWDAQCQ